MSSTRLILIALFSAALMALSVRAQSGTQPDPLEGLWVSETTFGPELRGEIIVSRRGPKWTATLAGITSSTQEKGGAIQFEFRDKSGQFRGRQTKGGNLIEGFWLQPVSGFPDHRDPGGTGQPFATPLTLRRISRNSWKGTVRPIESRFTLYLKIFRNAQGSVVAAFRNPDTNSRGGAAQFSLNREGNNIRFSARPDPSTPEIVRQATLEGADRIRITWPDLGFPIDLIRRSPSEALQFFPRPPGTKYVYRQPDAIGDGWTTTRAREAGIDEARLTPLVQRLIDADPADRRPSLIHSMLVAYRGKLVLEEYFFGFDRQRPHDTRSAGKTFASVMLGAVMRNGAPISPDTHVYDLFGGVERFANPDPRKSQITLAHLMTHTSGLACNDNDNDSPGNEGTMQSQQQEPDWWKYTLNLPMAHDPGNRYAYCSANTNLVGGALTSATRTWLPELFDRTIARPLQFGRYHWNLMPTGEGYQGGGAFLLPRDLLKVGQLYLNGGVWHGHRVVDSSWVTQSTTPRVHVSPATTGLSAEDFPNFYGEGDDAYTWHPSQLKTANQTYDTYAASGNGGQILLVVPKLDLVVVFTGGNYGQGGIWGRWGNEIVGKEIIPAIKR